MSATDALRIAAEHYPMGGPTFQQRIRLARFKAQHPEVKIRREFGEWLADVPLPDDDPYDTGRLHDADPDGLLDKLKDHLGPPG